MSIKDGKENGSIHGNRYCIAAVLGALCFLQGPLQGPQRTLGLVRSAFCIAEFSGQTMLESERGLLFVERCPEFDSEIQTTNHMLRPSAELIAYVVVHSQGTAGFEGGLRGVVYTTRVGEGGRKKAGHARRGVPQGMIGEMAHQDFTSDGQTHAMPPHRLIANLNCPFRPLGHFSRIRKCRVV